MQIGRVKYNTSYSVGGQKLCKICNGKDLGVLINEKLSSSDQVIDARRKAFSMLVAINGNVSYKSAEVIVKLFCACVRPHLENCIQAWSPMHAKDSRLI